MEETRKPRRGINRLILLVVLALSVAGAFLFPPIRPHVQLPAEPITSKLFEFLGQDFYITNTMVAVLIADVLLLLIAFAINRQIKQGKSVLEGISGAFAAILEALYDMTESTAGKHAKKIFPYFATIFLLVLVVNLTELIPGVDSIGLLHHDEHGYPVQEIFPGIATLVKSSGETLHNGETELYGLYPFVRVASTDLNFTVALALISVVMTQVVGLRTLGREYLTKYWNTHALKEAWKKPQFGDPMAFIMALIDWVVGILEIVAEFSKIISFAFRLFGVIFAGAVVLFVIGTLVPVFVQSAFLLLELLFGTLQAFIFGILTMLFMSMATQSHGHGEAGDEHH